MKFFFLLLVSALVACDGGPGTPPSESTVPDSTSAAAAASEIPYDLARPSKTFEMPGRLQEISGLSLSPDGQWLVAVNDEDGDLFFIDKKTGEVRDPEVDFGSGGDYEGVTAVGDQIFVVKSNGHLYRVSDPGGKDQKTTDFKNFLDSSNNVEGLAHQPQRNRLLLACKGSPGKNLDGQRAVYAFDLAREELLAEPAYLIDRKALEQYFRKEGLAERLIELFAPEHAADAFAPSGIAIHPHSDNVYIVANVGKLLVVLSPDGELKHLEKLDPKIHPQPEGICFDRDGTLYIASEGKGGKGRIVQYAP